MQSHMQVECRFTDATTKLNLTARLRRVARHVSTSSSAREFRDPSQVLHGRYPVEPCVRQVNHGYELYSIRLFIGNRISARGPPTDVQLYSYSFQVNCKLLNMVH